MNFLAAHVDGPVAAADEIITVSAQLQHVARVDEAVLVREGFVESMYLPAVREDLIRREPSSTFISTPELFGPIRLAGKPSSPSRTSNATPASVDAKACATSACG